MGKWAVEIVQVLRCESTLRLTLPKSAANSFHSTWKEEVVLADIRGKCAIPKILQISTILPGLYAGCPKADPESHK